MAFIAVNAKADITTENASNPTSTTKKGKVSPSQNAMVNAWGLIKKTGVFFYDGKCNPKQWSYSNVGNKSYVDFYSGYFAVCGRIVEVENGTTVVVDLPTSGTVNGSIVAKFRLSSSQEAEFEVVAQNDDVPLVQEDLNAEGFKQSGRYDFVLMKYTATPQGLTLYDRSLNTEKYGGDTFIYSVEAMIDAMISGGIIVTSSFYSDEAKYPMGDKNNGTILERLERLGFKTGSVSHNLGNATLTPLLEVSQTEGKVQIARQGNYVIGNFSMQHQASNNTDLLFILPEEFKPRKNVSFKVGFETVGTYGVVYSVDTLTIYTNGEARLSSKWQIRSYYVSFGFEAPPL